MKQLVVTAGVIVRHGMVLMAQRYPTDSEGGKWEFPGGKVEFGEDPRAGLQRELCEELGVKVEVGEVLDVVSLVKNDFHLILLYFHCRLVEGEPAAIDCQQVSWFSPSEAELMAKPSADQTFWEIHRHELKLMR